MLKIDKKDSQLLYELSRDARTSHVQLAKKLRLSKSSVRYRIDRLKEREILDRFTAVINLGAIDANTAVILVRFNEHITEQIKTYFRTHKAINWAATLSGQWDMLAEFTFRNLPELERTLETFLEHFSGKINSYEFFVSSKPLRVEHLVEDFYKDLNLTAIEQAPRTIKITQIDDVDKELLRLLSLDSESSVVALAEKIGKTVDTVTARMKKLVESGIIIRFFTEINLAKLGYTEYLYKIKLNNLDQVKITALTNEIKLNDNVKYAFLDMTMTHIIINFAFKDGKDLDEITSELRKKYHTIIDTQDYYLIKEQLKFDLFPEILLTSLS